MNRGGVGDRCRVCSSTARGMKNRMEQRIIYFEDPVIFTGTERWNDLYHLRSSLLLPGFKIEIVYLYENVPLLRIR